MFSTRSPTLTPRKATTPSIGDAMNDLARRASAVLICALAADVAASAASTAVFASSKACGVIRPNSFSCCARSYSRRARDSATRACASVALSASMPASVSVVSSRASRSPLSNRHPLGDVHRGDRPGDLGLHVGRELRLERADDLDAFLQVGRDHRARRNGHRWPAHLLPYCPALGIGGAVAGAGCHCRDRGDEHEQLKETSHP